MPSQYIGLIVGTTTRRVYAVLNPDTDADLDNPRHLLLQNEEKEPIRMIKVERGAYEFAATVEDIEAIVNQWYVTNGFNNPPQGGKENIEA